MNEHGTLPNLLLSAREEKWNEARLRSAGTTHALITLSVNRPGIPKGDAEDDALLGMVFRDLVSLPGMSGILDAKYWQNCAGPVLFLESTMMPLMCKTMMLSYERIRRCIDADIWYAGTQITSRLLGLSAKRCIVCGVPLSHCPPGTHSVEVSLTAYRRERARELRESADIFLKV